MAIYGDGKHDSGGKTITTVKKKKKKATAKTFIVSVKEIHIQPYRVTAESEDEALEIVRDGGGDLIENAFEYSHTMDWEAWDVCEEMPDQLSKTKGRK